MQADDTSGDESTVDVATPEAYFCPYCAAPAPLEAWWTTEQLDYAQGIAAAEVLRPMLGDFGADIKRLNRPGSLLRFDVGVPELPRPDPLTEPDDMVRVDFPCHPEEPLKIDEQWSEDVSCLVCGIHYPVELIRELPERNDRQKL